MTKREDRRKLYLDTPKKNTYNKKYVIVNHKGTSTDASLLLPVYMLNYAL